MPIFKVWVRLEAEYDDVEADSEEEAFQIASESAMSGERGITPLRNWMRSNRAKDTKILLYVRGDAF